MMIIAIAILLFLPLLTFNGLRLEFSLEWIVAFIVLIVGIVRAIILNSKIEELKFDLNYNTNNYKAREHSIEQQKPEFICEFCNSKFISEQSFNKHYLNCSKKKEHENNTDIFVLILISYLCLFLVLLFIILTLIFLIRDITLVYKIFIPISIILIVGFVLYMKLYLKDKISNYIKK